MTTFIAILFNYMATCRNNLSYLSPPVSAPDCPICLLATNIKDIGQSHYAKKTQGIYGTLPQAKPRRHLKTKGSVCPNLFGY
jgi:hypothetical protein